jgi:hypothetical protein
MVGCFKFYKGQAVGGKLDLMVLTGGAEERVGIQWEMSMWLRKRGDKKNVFRLKDHVFKPFSNIMSTHQL